MYKTITSALAAASLVGVALLVKLTSTDTNSIFTPVASNNDAAAVAAEKTAALKELFQSAAFNNALPSAQRSMIDAINDLYK